MTPERLFEKYKNEFCHMCTKENECNITVTTYKGIVEAKCTGYKQLDYCMQHRCNGCKKYTECFGGGNDGTRTKNR